MGTDEYLTTQGIYASTQNIRPLIYNLSNTSVIKCFFGQINSVYDEAVIFSFYAFWKRTVVEGGKYVSKEITIVDKMQFFLFLYIYFYSLSFGDLF